MSSGVILIEINIMAKPVNKIIAMCVAVELTNGCNNNQKLLYTPEREMVYKGNSTISGPKCCPNNDCYWEIIISYKVAYTD